MKIKLSLFLFVVIVCNPVLAADKEKPSEAAPSAQEQAKMMEMWMKLNAKGEPHKEFLGNVGKWKVVEAHFMGNESFEGKGTATFRSILDGRYLVQEYQSESQMGKYEGFGIMAYDNVRQQYVSTWVDSMSTGIFTSYGKKKGNTVTYNGKQKMPDGKFMQSRMVLKDVSPDKMILTMHGRSGDQKKFSKQMQITYTRVK